MDNEQIAKICHEANKGLCEAFGDTSQPDWDDAPQWQRDSAIEGVKAHIENDLSASASHDMWLAHKTMHGWRYGAVKNTDRKEHPCYLPFDDLPKHQKAKDYVFRAIVLACVYDTHITIRNDRELYAASQTDTGD